MPYVHEERLDKTTAWFLERTVEQDAAHEGEALRRWSCAVLAQLPPGPLELVATSTEGCALAAVVAATRTEAATAWRRVTIGRNDAHVSGVPVVVVEPMQVGDGLRAALERELPGARIIAGVAAEAAALAA